MSQKYYVKYEFGQPVLRKATSIDGVPFYEARNQACQAIERERDYLDDQLRIMSKLVPGDIK